MGLSESNSEKYKEKKGNPNIPKSILENIKNKYILKKIIMNLDEKLLLKIAKYNNSLQKIFELTIDDYKNYLLVIIEIEITKKESEEFYYFLNSGYWNYWKNKPYIHIFFDDSEREMNRNYITEKENISKIKIILDKNIDSFHRLFEGCYYIESIKFINFKRKNIIKMEDMFGKCSSLKKLYLSSFCTDNVTDMSFMFSNCSSLEILDLTNFNTKNVTNMDGMFSQCSSLKELNISSFNTNYVQGMDKMFN
jgi:surface protein